MNYVDKVIYKGNIVDIEDIICPGTELAHQSVGNLKKRMDNFTHILNNVKEEIETFEYTINKEINIIKETLEKVGKEYNNIITKRLDSEYEKYDGLYKHATQLITNYTQDLIDINSKLIGIDDDINLLRASVKLFANNDATLADQIIELKCVMNIIIPWIYNLYKTMINEMTIDDLKSFYFNNVTGSLIPYENDELKYDNIYNLTEEWEHYLSIYHPTKKSSA